MQSSSDNKVVLVVNGQIRKQEYSVQGNTVHIFDIRGDQFGFSFTEDELKESQAGESG